MIPSSDAPPIRSQEAADWLRAQQFHFDQLVSSVEDYAIFMMSLDGTILDWNTGAERLKGYTAAEIVGENFSRFYTPEDLAQDLPGRELATALDIGTFIDEGWRLRKDGSRFWATVTVTAVRSTSGEVAGFLNITRDLSAQRLAQETLRESEERLRLLIDSVQEYAIFLLDSKGHVMSWNRGARRIKQYEEHEILGVHFSLFYPPEALAIGLPASLLREALHEGKAKDVGWRVRKDGSTFWADVVITALYDEAGELKGYAKITRDLTAQRQIESLKDSGGRKDAFLATLAHELRNPLSPILTAAEMILSQPEDHAMVSQMAQILKNQVGQMTHLIDDLLDMARITAGKITLQKITVLLSEVVETAVQTVETALSDRRHEFVCELPDEAVAMEADPHRLSQIFTNLLANAAKYTPSGGKILFKVSVDPANTIEILVKDNGIGIPPVLQSSIFELFDQGTSGAADGLGIGLTLVKTLTELHGGTVSVHSDGPGCGSEFTVRMPLPKRLVELRPLPQNPPSSPTSQERRRVLVADDNRDAADTLRILLRMEGVDVAVAYDGEQAVEVAKTFSPQIAFLDLGMPLLSGLEAGRAIRRLFPDILLAALSGWGGEEDRRRTKEAGFDIHLLKPSNVIDIRAALDLDRKNEARRK